MRLNQRKGSMTGCLLLEELIWTGDKTLDDLTSLVAINNGVSKKSKILEIRFKDLQLPSGTEERSAEAKTEVEGHLDSETNAVGGLERNVLQEW